MPCVRVYQFGGPEVLCFEEQDNCTQSDQLAPDQVLVGMVCAGVNPVDTYIRSGKYPRVPVLPYIPGSDGAGRVLQVGDAVQHVKNGQRVFVSMSYGVNQVGTCSSEVLVPASSVYPLSDRLSFPQGAAAGVPYFTAWHGLIQQAGGRCGDRVLVHGASGGVGLAAVQIAKHSGMYVIGTAGSEQGMKVVKEQGADLVLHHKTSGYLEQLETEAGAVDIVLEMLADVNLSSDLKLLRPRGRVIIVGCRGSAEINPRLLMAKESSILGCSLAKSTQDDWDGMRSNVLQGFDEGWLNPVVHCTYPMKQAHEAHSDIIHSAGAQGNLVIEV